MNHIGISQLYCTVRVSSSSLIFFTFALFDFSNIHSAKDLHNIFSLRMFHPPTTTTFKVSSCEMDESPLKRARLDSFSIEMIPPSIWSLVLALLPSWDRTALSMVRRSMMKIYFSSFSLFQSCQFLRKMRWSLFPPAVVMVDVSRCISTLVKFLRYIFDQFSFFFTIQHFSFLPPP